MSTDLFTFHCILLYKMTQMEKRAMYSFKASSDSHPKWRLEVVQCIYPMRNTTKSASMTILKKSLSWLQSSKTLISTDKCYGKIEVQHEIA